MSDPDIKITSFEITPESTVEQLDAMAMSFLKEASDTGFWEPLVRSLEMVRVAKSRRQIIDAAKRAH